MQSPFLMHSVQVAHGVETGMGSLYGKVPSVTWFGGGVVSLLVVDCIGSRGVSLRKKNANSQPGGLA